MTSLRFLTSNSFKLEEAAAVLKPIGLAVQGINSKIEELQTSDSERLTRDKALHAFNEVGRPLFVEHTSLYLSYLNGFPGGLTQLFWDSILADRFAELFGRSSDPRVVARTHIVYCDGKLLHHFSGEASGRIAREPSGDRSFQWDCVFIPDGYDQTYAELGRVKKNEISMRRHALTALAEHLKGKGA
jgi:XTP/dITP diphosphohydrolase